MLQSHLVYDPVKDIAPVQQYGSIDLNEAFRTGGISSSVSVEQLDYNGIDDSESIIGKPRDVFEAQRLNEFVKSRGAKSPDGDGASGGDTPPATP